MDIWWGPLSAIIPSGTFIVLLLVLWKIMRNVSGLYISVTYTNDRLRELTEALQRLADDVDSRRGADAVEPATGEAPAATGEATGTGESRPADVPRFEPPPEPRIFVEAAAAHGQLKQKVLALGRQQPGITCADVAAKLGITVEEVKTICAELQKGGQARATTQTPTPPAKE